MTAVHVDNDTLLALSREIKLGNYSVSGFQGSHALAVGVGATGWAMALGLVKKAVGRLTLCDGDSIELSNLNRQLFTRDEVGKPKASTLARTLRAQTVGETLISAIDLFVEEAMEAGLLGDPTLVVSCPDNDEAREFVSLYCLQKRIPAAIVGLSDDGDSGYVFIQEAGSDAACWECLRKGRRGSKKCGVGASIDLPLVLAGFVLSACTRLISGRPLEWNYRRVSLSGSVPDRPLVVPKWEGCEICSKTRAKTETLFA